MADNDSTSTAAEPTSSASTASSSDSCDSSTAERLTAVENAVERIESAVSQLVPASHADAQARTERRLDRGSSVAEQVRAELARVKDEDAAAAAADGERDEQRQVQARLARLEERPPAPPRLARTRLLGWGDGRAS